MNLEASEPDPLLDMILLNAKEQYLCGGYILTYIGALHLIESFKTCYSMSD